MASVLLVGSAAEALAPRLLLSGYRPLALDGSGGEPRPIAVTPSTSGGRHPSATGVRPEAPDAGPAALEAAGPASPPPLAAVLLAPGEEGRIPALRQRWGTVPILLGLAEDSVEGRARTLLSGADDFWLTGLGPSDLLTRLRLHRQLPSSAVAGPQPLQVADLQVFPASREVCRGSRAIALTAREYQLLLLLLEQRGRVVSRDQILRQVWQDQQGGASNVIEVYVRYLRQKLEQGGERRLLHTVRGRGYCLCDGLPPPPEAG